MNPLEQLAPPILPPAISWWPPAPGWWLLALAMPLAALLAWRWRTRRRQRQATLGTDSDPMRLAALEALAQLQRPQAGEPASRWLQELNALLKRLCRSRYPDDHPHTLSGRAWLAFLDSRCPAAGLTRWMILVEGGYRAECRLDEKAIAGLEQAVEIWIRRHA